MALYAWLLWCWLVWGLEQPAPRGLGAIVKQPAKKEFTALRSVQPIMSAAIFLKSIFHFLIFITNLDSASV